MSVIRFVAMGMVEGEITLAVWNAMKKEAHDGGFRLSRTPDGSSFSEYRLHRKVVTKRKLRRSKREGVSINYQKIARGTSKRCCEALLTELAINPPR